MKPSPVDGGGSFTDPYSNSAMSSSAPPASQAAQNASPADPGITAGNFNIVWGNHDHKEKATATIKDNQQRTVGQVVFDTSDDTVKVTSYREGSGGPQMQPPADSAKSSTFKIDSDGNVVNKGDLTSLDAAPQRYDSFKGGRFQQVTLRGSTIDAPEIGVSIARDQDRNSEHALKVLITTPPSSGSPLGLDWLEIKSGGLDNYYHEVDDKQLTAQYISDWAGDDEKRTTYTSPKPPDESIISHVGDFLSWLTGD